MIDYSLAGKWALHVRAHAIIESNEQDSLIGDGGQAKGLLQQHPAFFKDYYGKTVAFPASVTHTWIEAEIIAAASFYQMWMGATTLEFVVQGYNLGMSAVSKGARNPEYLARWQAAYASIGGQ